MIDFYVQAEHYEDHLGPVFAKLRDSGYRVRWVKPGEKGSPDSKFAVAASHFDHTRAKKDRKMVFFFEHGAGQSYKGSRNPSYAGGLGRENVCLFLDPGPHVTAKNKLWYPHIPSVAVGVPKLDKYHEGMKKEISEPPAKPVVCFSFHWDCKVAPEASGGFDFFKEAILLTRDLGCVEVVGHCHPRDKDKVPKFYEEHGIEFIEKFDDVLQGADIYVCDNSSTIFEFASIGKPVVLLNPPHYRKYVNHGLRFWNYAGIGPNAWSVKDVPKCVMEVLQDSRDAKNERMETIREIYYGVDGKATERAVEGIVNFLEEHERTEREGNFLECTKTAFGIFGLIDKGQRIMIFPDYAIVNSVEGNFRNKITFHDKLDPSDRMRRIIKSAPNNYKVADIDYHNAMKTAIAQDEKEDYLSSIPKDEFTPANRELSEQEVHVMIKIREGLSKTKIVYKSEDYGVAELQRAWDRLESDDMIYPSEEEKYKWEIRAWAQ